MSKKESKETVMGVKNPVQMTDFEKRLAMKEKEDRKEARIRYVEGIQGRDGGECTGGRHEY